jgi:hypothetical protein
MSTILYYNNVDERDTTYANCTEEHFVRNTDQRNGHQPFTGPHVGPGRRHTNSSFKHTASKHKVLTSCLISNLWGESVGLSKSLSFTSCKSLNSALKRVQLSLSNENDLMQWFINISFKPGLRSGSPWIFYFWDHTVAGLHSDQAIHWQLNLLIKWHRY